MSKDIESWLKRLEAESASLDRAYMRSARHLPMHHLQASYTCNDHSNSPSSYPYNKRLLVTLNTNTGINTLAMLGVNSSDVDLKLHVMRKVYNGGAQWVIVYATPQGRNVTFNFTVDTLVKGTLDVREATHG